MGITVTLQAEDAVTYIPDFQDNREVAAAGGDAFECDLLPMSGADYDKLHKQMMGGKNMSGSALMKRGQVFIKRIIADNVIAVRGFALKDRDGNILEQPSNGAELYRVVMRADVSTAAIVDELVEAIKDQSALDAGDLGKLRPLSDSSAQSRPGKDLGPASDAADTNTTRTAKTPSKPSLGNGSRSAKGTANPETAAAKPRADISQTGIPN